MARKKHRLEEVLRALSLKNDVYVDVVNKTTYVLKDTVYVPEKDITIVNPLKKFDLGNSSWGKIDYLKNVHGFSYYFVNEFKKQ